MREETRTEYLARITAEHPGAWHRIEDLMRDWDHAHGYLPGAADVQGAIPVPVPDDLKNNAVPEGGDAAPSNAPPEEQT